MYISKEIRFLFNNVLSNLNISSSPAVATNRHLTDMYVPSSHRAAIFNRTYATINISGTINLNTLAMGGHNLTNTANVTFIGRYNGSVVFTKNFTGYKKIYSYISEISHTISSIEISINDPNCQYISISRLSGGVSFKPDLNIDWGLNIKTEEFNFSKERNYGGGLVFNKGSLYNVVNASLKNLKDDEAAYFIKFFKNIPVASTYISFYPNWGNSLEELFEGFYSFTERPSISHSSYYNYEMTFNVEESDVIDSSTPWSGGFNI